MHILRRMSKHLKAISLGSMALAAVGAIGWGVWHFRESRTMKTDDCRVEAVSYTHLTLPTIYSV